MAKRKNKAASTPPPGYEAAFADAQKRANETGFDHGIEQNAFGWSVRMLPARENRYGFELRVQVVSATDLTKCRPGHGPGPLANGWV